MDGALRKAGLDVIYDGKCRFCEHSLAVLKRLAGRRVFRLHDANDRRMIRSKFPMLADADTHDAMFVVTGPARPGHRHRHSGGAGCGQHRVRHSHRPGEGADRQGLIERTGTQGTTAQASTSRRNSGRTSAETAREVAT